MQDTKYEPANVDEPPVYTENTVEANDEPPKYNTLFERLKSAKTESKNPTQFVSKTVGILTGSVWLTIGLIFGSGLSIAMIVIGVLTRDKCNIEKYIPIWLIVFGATSLFSSVVKVTMNFIQLIKKSKKKEAKPSAPVNCLNNLIGLFSFAWFIAGNVWVYSNYNRVTYDSSIPERYCDKLSYLFSFWIINITWGFMVLTCCCICGVICCVGGIGLIACASAKENDNS